MIYKSFILRNYLCDSTYIAKNSDKSKWVYSGYGIALDAKSEWYLVMNLPEIL